MAATEGWIRVAVKVRLHDGRVASVGPREVAGFIEEKLHGAETDDGWEIVDASPTPGGGEVQPPPWEEPDDESPPARPGYGLQSQGDRWGYDG
jgi:hypothetical protein